MDEIIQIIYENIEEEKEIQQIIENVVKECFKQENIKEEFYISFTLTNDETIKQINKKYRNIDKPTDVLSFPMFEKKEIEQILKNKIGHKEILGDIIISIPKVNKQAKEYEHSFKRELAYMVVHGFYHLMGYDHIEEEDKIQMRKKEESILTKLKIQRQKEEYGYEFKTQ